MNVVLGLVMIGVCLLGSFVMRYSHSGSDQPPLAEPGQTVNSRICPRETMPLLVSVQSFDFLFLGCYRGCSTRSGLGSGRLSTTNEENARR